MREKRGYLDRARIRNKKAQITLFIIVAIVLLLSAGLYYYHKSRPLQTEHIPSDIVPVTSFVEECLDDISRESIDIIGQNGGYLNFPNEINNNPHSYLGSSLTAGVKNPYWWYRGKTAIPPLDFLKKEIVDYINDNFESCINRFIDFNDLYAIKEKGKFIASVDFTEEDVKIKLDYPLNIRNLQNNTIVDISDFFVELPIRVKKVHELASKIVSTNIKTRFLEYKSIDLISLDSDIPTTDFEVTCSEKRWLFKSVENKLKRLLEVNLPYIRVKGTSYNEDIYVPDPSGQENYSQSYFQNHYIMDIGESIYDDIHVAFIYDSKWPLNLVARPSDGKVLKSRPIRGSNLLSFFCMHIWHFTYDLEFPVKINIVDERTDIHDPYTFIIAILPKVDHLEPDRRYQGTVAYEAQDKLSNDEFCDELFYDTEILAFENTDAQDPVKDANLTLICGSYYCPLGQTQMFSLGAAAGIRKRLPLCSAGFIEVSDENYEKKKYPIQTDYDKSSHTILLEPIKQIKEIQVVKHSPVDYSRELELKGLESATISLSLINSDFNVFVPYPLSFDFPLNLKAKKDYTYKVDIYMISQDDFTGAYSAIWTVPWAKLEDAKAIKFHVVEAPFGEKEKSEFLSKIAEISKNVPSPELIVK